MFIYPNLHFKVLIIYCTLDMETRNTNSEETLSRLKGIKKSCPLLHGTLK